MQKNFISNNMRDFDINCDMGEGVGNDNIIMPFITSANIACGGHAGNKRTMKETILLAKKYNVNIGAHPSFKDKANFGRTEMSISPEKIYQLIYDQLTAFREIADACKVGIHHVKPHGALYNMAARDKQMAKAIAYAVHDFDLDIILFGLSGSHIITEGNKAGLKTASEVFADRTYKDDGSLTPRSRSNALITDEKACIKQVSEMISKGRVKTVSGKYIAVKADTICVHGDGAKAAELAEAIHQWKKNS